MINCKPFLNVLFLVMFEFKEISLIFHSSNHSYLKIFKGLCSICFSCRHGANACCLHCSPLEPFDEAYLKEQKIKHMSFHSYLRKLTAGVDR